MKNKTKKILVVVNFVLLFALTSFAVFKEETYRKQDSFYLKLAPVDPRSLMQGDYMTLNYNITDKALSEVGQRTTWVSSVEEQKEVLKRGYIVVSLDENKVAHFKDVVKEIDEVKNKENLIFIAFKSDGWDMKINADTFLFQEGDAKLYENAKYSKVVIVNNTLRLISLVDEVSKENTKLK